MIDRFLQAHGWGAATRVALAGDASARRYDRLQRGDQTAVLMLAPPEDRAGFAAFLTIGARLRELGLSAPEVIAAEPDKGLMLLEDLGDRDFTTLDPDLPEAARVTADLLIHLVQEPTSWNLPVLTPPVMAEMTRIALPDCPETDAALAEMQALFTRFFPAPPVVALRDVHAENLLWLPDRQGLARVGLLDFQDAVLAPAGYDLVSFTKDARRDISDDIAAAMIARYAQALHLDPGRFAAQCAALSFQRNLRIIGVFRRLARDRDKPAYLTHLPRVHRHVSQALTHPALTDLAASMRPLLAGIAP